jgi:hypothetical protein
LSCKHSGANVIKLFVRNLQMLIIGWCVYPRQAYPASFNVCG